MLASRRLDASARYPFDRAFAEIDKAHVRLIEDIKKILFKGRPLRTIRMNRLHRCEDLGEDRILDPCPRFVAPEVICGTVRLFVDKKIVERANPGCKATNLPNAFERRLPLVCGHFGRGLLEKLVIESPKRRSTLFVCERVALL